MNAPIKTDWFDGHVKPTSVGVYEREMPWGDDVFCKWDGENWINAATTIEAAAQCIGISHFQEQPWRGIVPEVDGCVPVEASPDNSCLGCEFIGQHARCYKAVAAADCYREVIIWRPRSEVEE